MVERAPEIVTEPSKEITAERKVQQELFAVGVKGSNNSCHPSKKVQGPLTTPEIAAHELFLVKRAQQQGMSNANFEQDQEQINLQPTVDGVLEC